VNLHALALQRAERLGPIGVALIGAGKFGSMFLAQAPTMPGLAVRAIADLDPDRVAERLVDVGWTAKGIETLHLTRDAHEAIITDGVEVVVEATGDPIAGIRHAIHAIGAGKHVVMVNVEADALAGPALAARARAAGVIYSLAYGDQPALIAELVDWARACGFRVAAAGKGTKYLPEYHASTPDTVWMNYGLTADEARAAGMNGQMFNSFVDGTKSAIEMAVVANACDLQPPPDGLTFPPCSVEELAQTLGHLGPGEVEVVSSLHRDGRLVERDLRWGVYVVVEAQTAYAAACFQQYGLRTDTSGRFAATYKPFHLIGMELGISIYSTMLRGEPTGAPTAFRGDVVAIAKRDLAPGDRLDGEGGYTVWGKLVPAERSVTSAALPIGLAKDVTMLQAVPPGQVVRLHDVAFAKDELTIELRRETYQLAVR
jgi:predicted homoserine dehydrogenase-like protein